jgi:hypothetical protein
MKAISGLVLLSQQVVKALFLGNRSNDNIISTPMYERKEDCGMKSELHIRPQAMSLFRQGNVPGAGTESFEPFTTVFKDGFMQIDCVKDYMFYRGDKFGDNKHYYELGPVAGVSIIHYTDYVETEDQLPMTPAACFEFCRTAPNMGFFGIVNGRDCYCTPYFKPMASDSSMCDAVCEGDTTKMCGGKTKSSIFSMHMCASTQEDLSELSGKASALESDMHAKVKLARGLAQDLQTGAEAFQKSFGAVGDTAASNLMQGAKSFAGSLESKAANVDTLAGKLAAVISSAAKLKDFSDPAVVTKAEHMMDATEKGMYEGEAAADELDEAIRMASPGLDAVGAAQQYYPVMYFVHKEYEKVPSTCGGISVAEAIVGEGKDGCASACDARGYVGFQYFDGPAKLCFLFSKIQSIVFYTGCGNSFLQLGQGAPPFQATCYAKLSKFEGTSLQPGKTDFGVKKLTKADRCYK